MTSETGEMALPGIDTSSKEKDERQELAVFKYSQGHTSVQRQKKRCAAFLATKGNQNVIRYRLGVFLDKKIPT